MTPKAKRRQPVTGKLFRRFADYVHTAEALRLLICAVTTLVMMALFVLAIAPVRYELRAGMVPTNTIAATKDVVDEIETEKRRMTAAAAVTPIYVAQEGANEAILDHFEQVFGQVRAVRQYGDTLPDISATRIFNREELDYAHGMLTYVILRDYQMTTLLRTTAEALEDVYVNLSAAIKNQLMSPVIQGQENTAIDNIQKAVGYRLSTDLLQNVVQPILAVCIKPNRVIDQEATAAAREEARKTVEDVVYKQGQNIVVKGEGRITISQLSMLRSLGLLSDGDVDWTMYLGGSLLVLALMSILFALLRRTGSVVIHNTGNLLLLCIVLVLTLGVSILARMVNIYATPLILCAMLLTAMLGVRLGIVCNMFMAVLVASLAAGSSAAYGEQAILVTVTSFAAGTVASLILSSKPTRIRALLAGVVAAGVAFLINLFYGLMTANELSGALTHGGWAAGGTMLAVLLCMAIQPLLEIVFNLPTNMKLMELSNPNQPLMRRLLLEAPGTYHHSIIVANLAEAAAEAVGANPLLARVGAYYHDIGKLKRPLYFKENQMAEENAHDHTDPQVSVAILTAHTRDGIALARQYRLPQAVIDIIAQHHGDTPVMFFYHKALQLANGKPVDIDAFRYDGQPPDTKESAIVLLCDTIEAAVRSLKTTTPENIEEFVIKLVRGKLQDGQLSNCPLTLKDIDGLCTACTTVLAGVFHERIEYPDVDKKQQYVHFSQSSTETPKMMVSDPAPERVPTVQPVHEPDPNLVVTPEPLAEAMPVVTPPPAMGPVAIEELITLEPLVPQEQKTEEPPPEESAEEEPKKEESDEEPAGD